MGQDFLDRQYTSKNQLIKFQCRRKENRYVSKEGWILLLKRQNASEKDSLKYKYEHENLIKKLRDKGRYTGIQIKRKERRKGDRYNLVEYF